MKQFARQWKTKKICFYKRWKNNMRNILNVIKRRIRNLPDKWKEGIVYPVIGTVVGGLILEL